MNKKNKALIRQFKNEYRAYLEYGERENFLRKRIEQLETRMGMHSPSLSDIHYSHESRDSMLAEYTESMTRLTDELELMLKQKAKVERVLARMDPKVREQFENIYQGRYGISQAACRMEMTCMSFRTMLDNEILIAYI